MWAFTAFFGMTIAVSMESSGMDIVRYMAEVETIHLAGLDISDWYSHYVSSRSIDMVSSIIAFTVAQFTGNGYYILILYGLIFGFFFSRNMWFVMERLEGKPRFITIILIVCMFLVVPIWFLNTFRFWTATHMFIYGLLPYLFTGKRNTLVWCFLAPFTFHFAFILPALVLAVFIFLRPLFKKNLVPYFVVFVISILVSEINIEQFNYVMDTYAPEIIAERTMGYRNEDYVYRLRNADLGGGGMVWYAVLYRQALHWSLMSFLLVLFLKSRELINQSTNYTRALGFTYFMFGVGNLMSSIPSGGRFVAPAALLATSILVIYIQNVQQEKVMQYAIKLATPLLLLFIIVSLREGLYLTSLTTIVGNPIVALFTIGENLSLNDVLKSWFR